MPTQNVRNITIRAANTNLDDGHYFEAMKLYSQSREYTKIYRSNISYEHIYPFVIKQNKDIFTDISNHYWDIEKKVNFELSILICF